MATLEHRYGKGYLELEAKDPKLIEELKTLGFREIDGCKAAPSTFEGIGIGKWRTAHYCGQCQTCVNWKRTEPGIDDCTSLDWWRLNDFRMERIMKGEIPCPGYNIGNTHHRGGEYIYAARAESRGAAIKIGRTKNPDARLRQFRTVLPDIEFIGLWRVHNARGIESSLHNRFADKNVGGEWYAVDVSALHDILAGYGG